MAFAVVQKRLVAGNSGAPSATLLSNPTAGNLLVVAFMANDFAGGISISAVPPGYQLIPTNGDVENVNQLHMWVYYKVAVPGESPTINATLDANRKWVVAAGEYSTTPGWVWGYDVSDQNTGSSTHPSSGTTAVTNFASELWVAMLANRNQDAQSAPTNTFVQEGTAAIGTDSTGISGGLYDKIVAGTGTASTSVTIGSIKPWVGVVATFYTLPPIAPSFASRGRAIQNRLNRVKRGPFSRLAPPAVTLIIPYPASTVAPVASGTPLVGQTLSVTNGSWTGTPSSFTYQWSRDNHGGGVYSAIPGATANTYLLVDADDTCHIRCQVDAYNARGSGTAASNVLGPVLEPPPANTVVPVVTGAPLVGSALTGTTGTWLHMGGSSGTFTYQWQTSPDGIGTWTDIAYAAAFAFYWPTAADTGNYLRLLVTATNDGGMTTAVSAVVGPIGTQATATALNVLGCGNYEVVVLTRGGRGLVAILPWTQIAWGRVLDDTSEASVSGLVGQDASCCAALNTIRPWRHEIGILRDNVLIWVGPVIQIQTPPGGFQITARDLSAWWDHRLIHETHIFAEEDLASIFQTLFEDAMAPDPSPGIILNATFSGISGTKRILTTQHQIAGPTLRDLSNTGIDWTAIGRTVLAGGLVIPTDAIGTFVDEHFATPPTPIFSGEQQANAPTVRGAGGGASGDRIYATADDFASIVADGLLESVESVSTITDYPSAVQAAGTQLALRKTVAQVEGCELAPTAPFTLDTLVPGALCHLSLTETCIPVSGVFRLKAVQGNVGADHDDSITLVFQPEGTTIAEGAPAT